MKKELFINNREEMIELGYRIGECAFPNMVITLDGDLGAGKTTFTKGIAKALGINEIVNSPTFTIMKIYNGKYTLYHLDVYRITDERSDFDLEEYFELDGVCVIEWANQIKSLLPDERLSLEIIDLGDDNRRVTLTSNSNSYMKIIEGITRGEK